MSTLAIQQKQQFVLTDGGLAIKGDPTIEDCRVFLLSLKRIRAVYQACLGEVARYMDGAFGEKASDEVMEQLELPMNEVRKGRLITRIDLRVRDEFGLSAEHYYVLSRNLEAEGEIERWAGLARDHKLTALELAASIARGKVTPRAAHESAAGHGTGLMTIQGVVGLPFRQWLRQVGGIDALLALPSREREQLLSDLEPIAEVIDALRNAE